MKTKLHKHLLETIKDDYEKCTACKACMPKCPMLSNYCGSPKNLMRDILENENIAKEIPFSCTLCGHCTHVCEHDVDLNRIFFQTRQAIVQNNEKIKSEHVVHIHQMNSFSKLFATGVEGSPNDSQQVFFPGCSLVASKPDIVLKIYDDLKSFIPNLAIMLNCCGNPTHVMGQSKKFNHYNKGIQNHLNNKKVEEIIVACPNCYNTLQRNSQIKVTSLWEILIKQDLLDLDIHDVFTIHDPCPTRHHDHIHKAFRQLLDKTQIQYKEMLHAKENTLCCGSGGMVAVTNHKVAIEQMYNRAQEAQTDHIITYCQECVESLSKADKKVYHILDLLYSEYNHIAINPPSTISKWINRYKTKKEILKITKEDFI